MPDTRLSDSEIDVQIGTRLGGGWARVDGALQKTFRFPDFHRTMAFVNAVAWIAHSEDHHPDLGVHYGRCVVRYSTHDAGGVTARDVTAAALVDALQAGS